MIRLIAIALLMISTPAWQTSAQVVRTEKVFIGKITDFFGEQPELSVTANKREDTKYLTVSAVSGQNPYDTATIKLTAEDTATIVTNLEQMVEESTKSEDELMYHRVENDFIASISGGKDGQLGFSIKHTTVGTYNKSESENRQILTAFIDLLKKGQAAISAKN